MRAKIAWEDRMTRFLGCDTEMKALHRHVTKETRYYSVKMNYRGCCIRNNSVKQCTTNLHCQAIYIHHDENNFIWILVLFAAERINAVSVYVVKHYLKCFWYSILQPHFKHWHFWRWNCCGPIYLLIKYKKSVR